jgi:type 2 lantibiotic biosynthesis protein LanM
MENNINYIPGSILNIFSKEINLARIKVSEKLESFDLPDDNKEPILEKIYKCLENRLLRSTEWTILSHYILLEKELQSNNTTEKINSFCELLLDFDIVNYFSETFPLMYDNINREIEQWFINCMNIYERYKNDMHEIESVIFSGENPGLLLNLDIDMGDKHINGESVSMLTFKNGKKLIYIPGERKLHKHFKELTDWIDSFLNIGFKNPKYIIHNTHTWIEFIEEKSCSEEYQINSFYTRTGANIALLYALEGSDFHYENIIACGEYPVIIDLESFFHPAMPYENNDNTLGLNNSVLKTGLLPTEIYPEGNANIGFSGMNSASGVSALWKKVSFMFDEKGKLKASREKGKIEGGKNLPILDGIKVTVSEKYIPDVINGFKKMYLFIMNNNTEFVFRIKKMNNDKIRIIFRNTFAYSHLLYESHHPDNLKNSENRDNLFNWLDYILKEYPMVKSIITFEKDDLINQTIPYFNSFADSRDLFHGSDLIFKNYFKKSGLSQAIEKIENFSITNMEKQIWIIEMSLSISDFYTNKVVNEKKAKQIKVIGSDNKLLLKDFNEKIDRSCFLNEAKRLGNDLIKSIKTTEDDAFWLVLKPADYDTSNYRIHPASYDLYSGMPGEIICLTYLGMLTGEKIFDEIAFKALNHITIDIETSIDTIKETGIFGGWGSIIYLFAVLSNIRKSDILIDLAVSWLKKIRACELTAKETNHGLVSGSAGLIISLLAAYKVSKNDFFMEIALKLSGNLLRCAYQTKDQIKWKGYSKYPLAGLSHGASGFALCYARLYDATGDKKYKEIVEKIINYENHLFNPECRNWPDLRDFVLENNNNNTFFSTAWSHGAPGIGLARLEIIKQGITSRKIKKDLKVSIETCMNNGFGGGHNLCYGDFGNLELIINSSVYFKDKNLESSYLKQSVKLMQDGINNGYRITKSINYTPGLMNGITGIIYQYMRLYDPKNIISLLSLSI